MSNRRNKPANRFGCKPTEDVCVEHDLPLECRHGCKYAKEHRCRDKDDVNSGFCISDNDDKAKEKRSC